MITAAYQNRRRRKRLRQRAKARLTEATADKNDCTPRRPAQGDWGAGSDWGPGLPEVWERAASRLSRADLALIRFACLHGWNPSQAVRTAIARTVVKQALRDPQRARTTTAAAATLIAMMAANQRSRCGR
jgi:hypothetical protein